MYQNRWRPGLRPGPAHDAPQVCWGGGKPLRKPQPLGARHSLIFCLPPTKIPGYASVIVMPVTSTINRLNRLRTIKGDNIQPTRSHINSRFIQSGHYSQRTL
jgi:hypothetical protein